MKRSIVYILGLFEDQENLLFRYLKEHLESSEIECHSIEPFAKDKFGVQTFHKTVKRAQDFIDLFKPEMIVAHSLGAYLSMQISTNQPVVLLDPSLAVADIVLNNLKQENESYLYDDGKYRINLSSEFVESIKSMSSIEKSISNTISRDIYIFGSGKGGYKIAEQYHEYIPCSHYTFLPDSDHEFSNENDRQQILAVIKKRLDAMPSRGGGVHTKSW